MKKILLLAGEESGVIYADKIKAAVLARCPDAEVRGYGDYGFEIGDLAVFGIWAVLRRIFYFLRVKRVMSRAIRTWRPDVVCTVDYPGMNLKLAAYAKSIGVKAVHVVCPQVWAWHQGRIPKIERALDKLCCFFPFEPSIFKPGLAEFVGHPLVDAYAPEIARLKALREQGDGSKTLALLPGSRLGEINFHMPVLLKVCKILKLEIPNLKVVVPAANQRAFERLKTLIDDAKAEVVLQMGGARELLARADAAAVSSGTATLEAALVNCPTVLVYQVSYLLGVFLRHAITGVKHVGLANIIAEKSGQACPMPELLQENFTVENILAYLRPWLVDPVANSSVRDALSETLKLLKSDGDSIDKIARFLI